MNLNGQIITESYLILTRCAIGQVSINDWEQGSGCGSVGRAVASHTKGPQFESSHWQNLYWTFVYLFAINCIEKTNINKKRPGMANFLKIKRLGALEADKWTCTRIKRLRHMKYRYRCEEMGGSPGLVVTGRDSRSRGRGFESLHVILVGHFSHNIVNIVMFVWKDRK